MFMFQATDVIDRTRRFFSRGHKSGNKRYHVTHTGNLETDLEANFTEAQVQKFKKRYEESRKGKRLNLWSDPYQIAIEILKTPPATRTGNCLEMACLSAHYAYWEYGIDKRFLYIADFDSPGDHAFCLVTEKKGIADDDADFNSVADLMKEGERKGWLIIDPWLNVCCRTKFYIDKANEKLEKWGGAGKRISWTGSKGLGWYPANGEYKEKFSTCSVTVKPFFPDIW